MRLNYSLTTWTYEAYMSPSTLEDAVADARRSGYGIELWPRWKGESDLFAPEKRERIVKLLKDIPSSLHGGARPVFEEHKTQIDAAKDTESSIIVVHNDHLGLDEPAPDYGLAREVVAYAKEAGVTIALENIDQVNALFKQNQALVSVPGLMACLDVGHIYGAHDHPLREYLDRLDDKLVHLHLQDVYLFPGSRHAKNDSHRPPGQCDIPFSDWQTLFSVLKKMNYSGTAVIEVRPFDPVETASQVTEFFESVTG